MQDLEWASGRTQIRKETQDLERAKSQTKTKEKKARLRESRRLSLRRSLNALCEWCVIGWN
jgi:hypothetical protein